MPRATPPLQLPRSPLIFVLAQVKISPVMAIEGRIPDLQESLRKHGYPRRRARELKTSVKGAEGQVTQVEIQRQWEFINKESTASLVVDENGLTYQTSEYAVFETLVAELEAALGQFAEFVEPGLVQRVGLRYVDLVVPTGGKEISAYFSDGLRGFRIAETDAREAFFFESVCRTGPDSKFIHRYVEALGGFGFPPDLLPVSLNLRREPLMDSPFALLDLDHYRENDEDFSVETAIRDFDFLHEYQSRAFKASITQDAIDEWSQP